LGWLEEEAGKSSHQDAAENMNGMTPEEQQEKYTERLRICINTFKRD
jgi:hypothetical protein